MKRFQEAIDDLERRKPGEYTREEKRDWAANRSVILDEGEFVARWDKCQECWHPSEGEMTTIAHYGRSNCPRCNGTGRVAVPVGTEPVEVGK